MLYIYQTIVHLAPAVDEQKAVMMRSPMMNTFETFQR
jgi:hypothetical protein